MRVFYLTETNLNFFQVSFMGHRFNWILPILHLAQVLNVIIRHDTQLPGMHPAGCKYVDQGVRTFSGFPFLPSPLLLPHRHCWQR